MNIGFTGTRMTPTQAQEETLRNLLMFSKGSLHHGDCVGADALAHRLALEAEFKVWIHPPVDEKLRAFCTDATILPPKTHFERNRDIVNSTEILIAVPFTDEEQPTGGTWYTVAYARKRRKPIYIIERSGRLRREGV